MVQSSFYGDTPNYAADYPTQNDSNTNSGPNTPAPSSFYPDGGVYTALANSDTVVAQLAADLAAAQAAQAAAQASATSSSADAAAAHQAYLDAVALLATALLKANNLSDLTNTATARTNIGLGNVDNTSDVNKPVSTAQQTALNLKANLASPALTGTPTAPTAAPGTNTTQLATTAFVEAARVILAAADALKAPLASPALTGTPTAPTAAPGTNTTQIATTAFALANGGGVPATATPIMDGTAAVGTATKYAREDHVHPTDTSLVKLAGNQTITGGYIITPVNLGTASGTVTPNPASGNYQYLTNAGAFTLAAPTSDCAIDLLVNNTTGAGSITFSGFTTAAVGTGDALNTTTTSRFIISIRRIASVSTYTIKQIA